MPRFAFTPIENDPFAAERPDASGPAIAYAGELGGAPGASQDRTSKVIRRTVSNAGNLLMAPANALGEFGNRLMGTNPSSVALDVDSNGIPRDTSAMDTAATLSGVVMEGGLAMPKPSNALGVFGGMNAKTANLKLLGDAMRADVDGASPEAIHAQTGWFKGVDGKWRFEISDANSKFSDAALESGFRYSEFRQNWMKEHGLDPKTRGMDLSPESFNKYTSERDAAQASMTPKLGDVLEHPDLYAAYPGLKTIPVKKSFDSKTLGYYDTQNNLMAARPNSGRDSGSAHSTILHETQHAIQTREGFAHGGSPEDPEVKGLGKEVIYDVQDRLEALRKKLSSSPVIAEHDAIEYTYLTRLAGKLGRVDNGTIGYNSLAGEVEARNVQTRHAENTPTSEAPWLTEDTPKLIQKVRNPLGWYRGAHE